MADVPRLPWVAWWTEGGNGVESWVLTGPGPHPVTENAWLHQLALPQTADRWAIASQPPLGPLPRPLTDELRSPVGSPDEGICSAVVDADGSRIGSASGRLREASIAAGLALIGARLGQDFVRETPRESGIVLLRLRRAGPDTLLDIAPAIDQNGWLGRSVLVDLRGAQVVGVSGDVVGRIEPGPPQFGATQVTIGAHSCGLPVASLPVSHPELTGDATVTVAITLPTLIHRDAPEPVVALRLRATD